MDYLPPAVVADPAADDSRQCGRTANRTAVVNRRPKGVLAFDIVGSATLGAAI